MQVVNKRKKILSIEVNLTQGGVETIKKKTDYFKYSALKSLSTRFFTFFETHTLPQNMGGGGGTRSLPFLNFFFIDVNISIVNLPKKMSHTKKSVITKYLVFQKFQHWAQKERG